MLFIPKKLKIGYNYREECYTKKLAYIIYYDEKGKLRKEYSWENWIQTPGQEVSLWTPKRKEVIIPDDFEPHDLDNVPTEGFVINKTVGGVRDSWSSWNVRNEYIRVFDPRGFEFEISVPNLLFILAECTSTKGKGLEGKFVYGYDGGELLLIPVHTQEYKKAVEYSENLTKKITKKDIEPGSIYQTKKQESLIYLGRFDVNFFIGRYWPSFLEPEKIEKRHVFYNEKTGKYYLEKGFTKLSLRLTNEPVDNFAELIDSFEKTLLRQKIERIRYEKIDEECSLSFSNCDIFIKNDKSDDILDYYNITTGWGNGYYINTEVRININPPQIIYENYIYRHVNKHKIISKNNTITNMVKPYAILTSGEEIELINISKNYYNKI